MFIEPDRIFATSMEYAGDRVFRITFSNGKVGNFDVKKLEHQKKRTKYLEPIYNESLCRKAYLNEYGDFCFNDRFDIHWKKLLDFIEWEEKA